MDLFNIICGVCSVVGLLVSLFTANKVIKISSTINYENQDDHSKVTNKLMGNTIHGSYTGKDSK